MTEKPSQNQKILDKLDNLTEQVGLIKQDLSGIKQQIKMQPQIDAEQHKTIEKQISQHSEDIKSLKDTNTWIVRSVLLEILGFIALIIYQYMK